MTVQEVLRQLDRLCPNQYDDAQKLLWLSALEGQLYGEIAAQHTATARLTPPVTLTARTVLLAPDPYAGLYVDYLRARIAQANNETERCNDAAADFQAGLRNWWSACTRASLPVAKAARLRVM